MFNIFKQFIPKFIFVILLLVANNVFANESFSEPDTLVSFTATLPAGTTSARLHSEALGWDTSHPDGVASYNGDGTWTATIPAPWAAGTNYKWVADGVEENLKDDVDAGYCANDGLISGDWGANRVYSGSGDVTGEVFGECSDNPSMVAVTYQVDMTALDTSLGVSVVGGSIFGVEGLEMSDEDGDGIYAVTTYHQSNSIFMFKYRNTTASTWDNQESVPADCGHGEWSDRQVVTEEADIVLDVVAFGSCSTDIPAASNSVIPTPPVPTDAIDSVLSIFSTTYGNLAGTNFNPHWGQSTQVTVGDVLSLENLNYQGIEFSSEIDVSGYEYLNVSYYVIESIPVNFFLVSPSGEKSYALNVSAVGEWNNVQIPLSHYDNVNLADVIQLKVDSTEYCWNNNCFIAFSNIYFGGVTPEPYPDTPSITLLVDLEEEAEAYEIAGFDGGVASVEAGPGGANSLKYVKDAGQTWAGVWINLEKAVDVANGEIITADVYSTVARDIRLKFDAANVERVVSHGGTGWESLSYDFTGAMPGDQTKIVFFNDLFQLGDGTDAWTIYIDNLAQTNGGDTPEKVFVTFQVDMTAVETNADGVYIAGGDFGQDGFLLTDDGSDVWRTTVSVNTNTQVIYKFRNQPSYGGWDGFEDSWGLIDGGCVTGDYYDRFVDIAEANIVLDVVAFGSCTADAPAPEPEPNNEDVLSLFSNKYGQWEVYNFNPDWGQSTEVNVGDDVLTFTNLDYQGIEIHNADVSGYEYLHIDVYTNDSSALNVSLISEGAENGYSLDDQIETGHWFSVDIPLENYIADLTNITQLKFVGNGTVLLDNIYFGGVAPTPEVYCAAPVKHFNIEADTASAVLLTIERVDANNIDVSVSSADADPIDLLIIGVQEDPATAVGAMTLDNGTATIRLTYDAGAPDRTKFEVLWSKESTGGNWMLRREDLSYVDTMNSCYDFELIAFEGSILDGSVYTVPSIANAWSGFGNINPRLYPITVAEDSVITFTGSVPSGGDAVVRFRFEANLYPNTEPSFNTGVVLVSGSEPATYSIAVPSQGANTFNSFIMYLDTRDVGVSVTDIAISVDEGGDAEGPDPVIPVSPVPTDAADSVLSIFSNTYGNLPGIDFNPNWGQETQVTVGDVLTLENLNYQGIQLPSEVDVSGYGYLHLDIFVDQPKSLEVFLVQPGPSERSYMVDIKSSSYCGWQSIRIPLNEFIFGYDPGHNFFPDYDLTRLFQFKFVGTGKYHIGNMYFGGEAPDEWSEPNSNPAPAIKIYDSVPITHFGIEAASESTVLLTVERVDEKTLDVSIASADTNPVDSMTIGNNFPADISSMSLVDGTATITLTYYSQAPLITQLELIWSKESTEAYWILPMDDFPMASALVACEYGGTPPPPEPNPEGEVLSIFSDTLGNMSGANFYAQWGQATQVTVSDVLTYSNLDYQGIEIPDTYVLNYEYLHIDFYTNDLSALAVHLVSHPEGATTNAISLTDQIVTGQWVSVEIPIVNIMTGFDSANKSVNQLIFEGNGTVLLGNIYFGELASPKGYCAAPVTHSNIEAETASAVLLTVDRVDANSIDVSVTSADTDPVDFLMIEIPYAQNVQISDMTLDDGTATVTLTWFDVAPDSVSLDVFWSKESTDANWMLRRTDLSYIDTSYGCDEFVFSEYGGASIVGSEYITPTETEPWAGFANANPRLYPITFNEHSAVTFTASVPSGEDALVSFRFEANPYPDIRPFFKTLRVKVSGDEPATYSACVPSQGDNLFNSVQMYLETRDVAVVIDNVSIESDASCTSADPITPEFLAGAPTPTINQDEVVSLFSDQYSSSLSGVYPDFLGLMYGFESEITIDNENTIKRIDDFIVALYPLPFETSIEDKTMLSVSLYSQRSFDLEIRLNLYGGGNEIFYQIQSVDMPTDQWFTVDIDMSDFSGSLSNISALVFVSNDHTQRIYVDDIYFHGKREPVLTLTVTAPDATSVGFTGEWWNWETDNPAAPEVIDNGNGTWTAIFDHNSWFSPDAIMNYAWVIDGVVENLENLFGAEECDLRLADGTLTYDGGWRTWISGSGDVIGDVAGTCDRDSDSDGVADMYDFAPEDPSIWATQTLSLSGNSIGNLGELFPVEIEYDVSNNNNQLSGTGFRLHYNSEVVSIESFENLLSKDMVVEPTGPFVDLENYDNDELTDEYYLFGWASLLGDWPSENLPAKLMTVQLNLLNNHQFNTTSINISKSSSPIGYEFEAEPFNLELEEKHTWDFDQDGQVDALTDGLILMRHGFSLSGENLIRDATNNLNITHQDVTNALEDAQGILDIDGNGHFDALTDGLILMRYLFSLSGENLIDDAISTSANRISAAEITSYIQLHMP